MKMLIYHCEAFRNLAGVEEFIKLQHLDVERCENLTSVPDLTPLTQLETIEIIGCGLITAPVLPQATKEAYFEYSKLVDIQNLQYLKNIEKLNLNTNELSNAQLKFIAHLTTLIVLDLWKTNLTQLSLLSELVNLEELYVVGCQITDVN